MRKVVKIGIYGILGFVVLLNCYFCFTSASGIYIYILYTAKENVYNYNPMALPNDILHLIAALIGIFLTTFFIVVFALLNKHKTLFEASKYVYFNFEILKQERMQKREKKELAKKEKKNNKIQRKKAKLKNKLQRLNQESE